VISAPSNSRGVIVIDDESISYGIIKEVGIGGEYLSHPETLELCRTEYFSPNLMFRDNFERWDSLGRKRVDVVAHEMLKKRLEAYIKPAIDEGLEKTLIEYAEQRKKQILG